MAKTKTNNLVYLKRDRGYRFTDRDPEMEKVCTAISGSGLSTKEIQDEISKMTGGAYHVGRTTMDNWLMGRVKRPQNFTLTWVMAALGFRREWKKI